jgi:hypothetical protein
MSRCGAKPRRSSSSRLPPAAAADFGQLQRAEIAEALGRNICSIVRWRSCSICQTSGRKGL